MRIGGVPPQKAPRRAGAGKQGPRCTVGGGRVRGKAESFGGGQDAQTKRPRPGQRPLRKSDHDQDT